MSTEYDATLGGQSEALKNSFRTVMKRRGYKFGDFSRSVLHKYIGKDAYTFGDISRKTFAHVTGLLGKLGLSRSNSVNQEPATPAPTPATPAALTRETSTSATAVAAADPDERLLQPVFHAPGDKLSLEEIWGSFFVQVHTEAKAALAARWITIDDLAEPFIYVGLPAVALVDTLTRSLGAPHGSIVLACGMPITKLNSPPELYGLLDLLVTARSLMAGEAIWASTSPTSAAWLAHLKHRVLMTHSVLEIPPLAGATQAQQLHINRVTAQIQAVALGVSQLYFFKQNFQDILESLLEWAADNAVE